MFHSIGSPNNRWESSKKNLIKRNIFCADSNKTIDTIGAVAITQSIVIPIFFTAISKNISNKFILWAFSETQVWVIDLGASIYICNNFFLFIKLCNHYISIVDISGIISSTGIEYIYLPWLNPLNKIQYIELSSVLYISNAAFNLLLLGALSAKGIYINFKYSYLIKNSNNLEINTFLKNHNSIYILSCNYNYFDCESPSIHAIEY